MKGGISGELRFAPAPPIVRFVLPDSWPTGPSPYTCPGVDKPPDIPPFIGLHKNKEQRIRDKLLEAWPPSAMGRGWEGTE